jgi:translation initiation factor 3 subunit A
MRAVGIARANPVSVPPPPLRAHSPLLPFGRLCVDMKKGRVAKEGLIQYRIACQQVNVASLEEVIKLFLKLATDRAEAAQAAASGSAALVGGVEDLEADTSPEDLMLAYVSAEKRGDRADRELVTPWFKFLWEAYRTVLEILRNNSKLEALYAMTAHRAFGFCATYKRTTEFRRLCEILRNHLANLNKYRDARDRPDLTQADSLALYLETRFEQLKTAADLSLWQEAFRSVEDIHGLMSTVKQKPKPAMMAVYYAKLARVFAVSEGCAVYHAYALWKLYALSRSYNKNLTGSDVRQLASGVLLAALAVPPYDGRAGAAHAELEADKERNLRMATLLGFTLDPKRDTREVLSRSALLAELSAKGLLGLVHPEVRELHALLEGEFHPLDLCARVGTALGALRALPAALSPAAPLAELPLGDYARRLEVLASLRALQQVGAVYASMRLDALAALIPFQPFCDTEKLIVDAVKHNFLSLRLDHRAKCVHFGAPRLEADLVRAQITHLAQRLATATGMMAAIGAAPAPARPRPDVPRVLATISTEHRNALARKAVIEKRKEEAERVLMEHEREEEARKLATLRAAEDAERKRLEEERRSREEERIRADIEEKELEEARVLLAEAERRAKEKASKKAGTGAKPGAKPGAAAGLVPGAAPLPGTGDAAEGKLDKRQLMEDALAEQIRERQELEKKLAKLARTMDHFERARREEERPLLEAAYKRAAEQDAVYAAEQTASAAAAHKTAWEADVAEKARLAAAAADKEAFASGIMARRAEALKAAMAERDTQLAHMRAQRQAEATAARKRELLKRLREVDAAHRRAAEEESRARRAQEEEARRAEEETERLSKLEEMAAARARERERDTEQRPSGAPAAERWGGAGGAPPRRDEAPPARGGGDRWSGAGGGGGGGGGGDRWAPRGGDDRGGYGAPPRRDGPPAGGGGDRWGGGGAGAGAAAPPRRDDGPPRRDDRPPAAAPGGGGRFDSKWGK